jgi:hypothetical protein
MSHLTTPQRSTLLAAIKAHAVAGPLRAAGNVTGLLAWCNAAASPEQTAWKTAAPVLAIEEAPSYTAYDSLAQGKRDSWLVFIRNERNFTRAKVRAWVVDIWGNATNGSNSEAVLRAATEPATNAQLALGSTARSTGTVTALDRAYSEDIDFADGEWLCQQA